MGVGEKEEVTPVGLKVKFIGGLELEGLGEAVAAEERLMRRLGSLSETIWEA